MADISLHTPYSAADVAAWDMETDIVIIGFGAITFVLTNPHWYLRLLNMILTLPIGVTDGHWQYDWWH